MSPNVHRNRSRTPVVTLLNFVTGGSMVYGSNTLQCTETPEELKSNAELIEIFAKETII